MSNINDKLIQLAETKSNIRDAIISKGVEVDTSLPFGEYADKIEEIKAGDTEFINAPFYNGCMHLPVIDSTGTVSFAGAYVFINNIHNRNDFGVLKMKFYISSSATNPLVHTEGCYNFQFNSYKPSVYCWKTAETFTDSNALVSKNWYYLCIRFDKVNDTTVRKRYYLSDENFYIDDDHKLFDFEDNISIDEVQGCIGSRSSNTSSAVAGGLVIDPKSVVLEDYNGNVLKSLWVDYPVNMTLKFPSQSQAKTTTTILYTKKDFLVKSGESTTKYISLQAAINDNIYFNTVPVSNLDIYFNFTCGVAGTGGRCTLFHLKENSSLSSAKYFRLSTDSASKPTTLYALASNINATALRDNLVLNSKANYLKLSFDSAGVQIYHSKNKGKTYEPLQDYIPLPSDSIVDKSDVYFSFLGESDGSYASDGTLYYSTRIVDRNTGEVIWKLGKD